MTGEFASFDPHDLPGFSRRPRVPSIKYPTHEIRVPMHLFVGSRDTMSDEAYFRATLPAHTNYHSIDVIPPPPFHFFLYSRVECFI